MFAESKKWLLLLFKKKKIEPLTYFFLLPDDLQENNSFLYLRKNYNWLQLVKTKTKKLRDFNLISNADITVSNQIYLCVFFIFKLLIYKYFLQWNFANKFLKVYGLKLLWFKFLYFISIGGECLNDFSSFNSINCVSKSKP